MGDPKGFLTIKRKEGGYRPVTERIYDFGEEEQTLNGDDRQLQASRCMDCGVPFCHWACPVGSKIPEWQDALYRGYQEEAYTILNSTNSFPEFTGRVCPALCEKSCVLSVHDEAVTIRENEAAVVETAFDKGLVKPSPPVFRTGKKVAVIGSGPAGLSAADRLNRAGHLVTVFEKNDAAGGLLRYGIPDFKLNKQVIDRRLTLLWEEGIDFKTNVNVGRDLPAEQLLKDFDAVVLALGVEQPRDLPVEGRTLDGIHFALDYLSQNNRKVAGKPISGKEINAKGKQVLVIGGGDTGSDCVGTAIRQRAASVTQIEILPKPPEKRPADNPWPYQPLVLRTSSSHLIRQAPFGNGCIRRWGLMTKKFSGGNGNVNGVEVVEVKWTKDDTGRRQMEETGKPEVIKADLVLLAMGFTQPVHEGLLNALGVEYDFRGNVKTDDQKQTSVPKVFAAGDVTRGAGLVVHAIYEGQQAARFVDDFLKKTE